MSTDETTKQYLNFLKDRGIELSSSVQLPDSENPEQGRSLRAQSDIAEGDLIFKCPISAVLDAEADKRVMDLAKKHQLDAWSALIVRMMIAQTTPEWRAYFDALPTKFNTPIFWDPAETSKLLQGSTVLTKIGRESADDLYDKLAGTVLKELEDIPESAKSQDCFHRMGSLIMAYAFDMPHEGDEDEDEDEDEAEDTKVMVPLAELVSSHSKLQNARLTLPETGEGAFEMVASRPIKAGELIYVANGGQPSGELLRRYGFVETGGSSFEAVEISRELVLETARECLDANSVDKSDAKFDEYVGDIDSFEISVSTDDESDIPELEIEPELLIYLNCLATAGLKRREFKEIAAMAESQKLLPSAKQILAAVLAKRKEEYGPVPDLRASPPTLVWRSKEDMCAQVRHAELQLLDMALDWLDAGAKRRKI